MKLTETEKYIEILKMIVLVGCGDRTRNQKVVCILNIQTKNNFLKKKIEKKTGHVKNLLKESRR